MSVRFTDAYLRKFPNPPKSTEIRDKNTIGLVVRISPRGKKVWYHVHRRDGKLRRINLGQYPIFSLLEARQASLSIKQRIDSGLPAIEGSQDVMTVEKAYREWIKTKKHLKRPEIDESIFRVHLLPTLGEYRLDQLTIQICLAPIKVRIDQKKMGISGMMVGKLKEMLSWAVMNGYISNSPMTEVSSTKLGIKKNRRDRVLTLQELQVIWASDYKSLVVPMLQFLMLSFLRGGECRQLKWDMINWEDRRIVLPGEIMKMNKEHDVYIVDSMMEILRRQEQIKEGPFVWSTGYYGKELPKTFIPARARELRILHHMQHWVPHDCRRNIKYLSDDLDIPWHVCDMLLAHQPPGLMATYQHGTLYEQRKDALIKWEQFLIDKDVIPQ